MPLLDGFGLLREIRGDMKLRHLPVLMLSARAGEEAKVEGLRAGADDYLAKPFEPKELVLRIKSILKRNPESVVAPIPGLTSSEEDLLNILRSAKGEIVERSILEIGLKQAVQRQKRS